MEFEFSNERKGPLRDRPPFGFIAGFIAGKRSVKFRFPEADIHHRVLPTLKSRSAFRPKVSYAAIAAIHGTVQISSADDRSAMWYVAQSANNFSPKSNINKRIRAAFKR